MEPIRPISPVTAITPVQPVGRLQPVSPLAQDAVSRSGGWFETGGAEAAEGARRPGLNRVARAYVWADAPPLSMAEEDLLRRMAELDRLARVRQTQPENETCWARSGGFRITVLRPGEI